jgi:hypothetical protein
VDNATQVQRDHWMHFEQLGTLCDEIFCRRADCDATCAEKHWDQHGAIVHLNIKNSSVKSAATSAYATIRPANRATATVKTAPPVDLSALL